jgi:hypothetical protein
MAHAQTSAPILLQPAYETTIAYQTPHGTVAKPVFRLEDCAIYDLRHLEKAFWVGRKPWEVFDTERVVDIDMDFDENQHRNISDRDWLSENAPVHDWFWSWPAHEALAALNAEVTQLRKKCAFFLRYMTD